MRAALTHTWERTKLLLKNGYFWVGLVLLIVILAALGALFNFAVMPVYTRHADAVTVPDVTNMPFNDAHAVLRQRGLTAEEPEVQRFNPDLPRDVVVSQNPSPNAQVKPGRRVYLTINSGRETMVRIPPLQDLSLREAKNRLVSLGLTVEAERPDSIPSPFSGTVTRQEPAAGDSLREGGGVTLWYSTGPGDRYVTVPDVTRLSVEEARQTLLDQKLRAVVLGLDADLPESEQRIVRQGREPGTRLREGSEIRLFVGTDEDTDEVE